MQDSRGKYVLGSTGGEPLSPFAGPALSILIVCVNDVTCGVPCVVCMYAGGGSVGTGLALADEVVQSTMDAAFEDKLKEGAEAFEFQAEVSQ